MSKNALRLVNNIIYTFEKSHGIRDVVISRILDKQYDFETGKTAETLQQFTISKAVALPKAMFLQIPQMVKNLGSLGAFQEADLILILRSKYLPLDHEITHEHRVTLKGDLYEVSKSVKTIDNTGYMLALKHVGSSNG